MHNIYFVWILTKYMNPKWNIKISKQSKLRYGERQKDKRIYNSRKETIMSWVGFKFICSLIICSIWRSTLKATSCPITFVQIFLIFFMWEGDLLSPKLIKGVKDLPHRHMTNSENWILMVKTYLHNRCKDRD